MALREIIFHGKRKDNGEWVEGCLCVFDDYADISYRDQEYSEIINTVEVIPETVGQDTGLKDKNGKTIFEGDIVLFGETPLVVYWNGEAFGWCAKAEQHPFRRFPSCRDWDYIDLGWIAAEAPCTGEITTEIIGNIHDNPEILKEGGKNERFNQTG